MIILTSPRHLSKQRLADINSARRINNIKVRIKDIDTVQNPCRKERCTIEGVHESHD